MSEHTAGPWKVGAEQLRGGLYWYVAIPGAEETIDLHESENGEANARLIAAAPDMLAALLSCLEHCEKEGGADVALIVDDNSGHMLDVEMIRAAIKKATTP